MENHNFHENTELETPLGGNWIVPENRATAQGDGEKGGLTKNARLGC